MQLNIWQKMFSITITVLVLMITVSIYSIRLTANINDELADVSGRYLPVNISISEINVKILEQGVVLQRLFVHKENERGYQRFKTLRNDIVSTFDKTLGFLKQGSTKQEISKKFVSLKQKLKNIEVSYQNFESHGWYLVETCKQGDLALFNRLLPDLNTHQDAIDLAISDLRIHIEELTDAAVLKANRNERFLLYANTSLTVLAVVIGLGITTLITRALVRNIRNLVRGAEAIKAGELDTKVLVKSQDEIGQLTESFNDMVKGLRLRDRIRNTFGKYMDPRVVSELIDCPELAEPRGEKREMTVLFIDLKGFTSISERILPLDLVKLLNDFFTLMTEAIASNKGVVDKFIGDAVMAYWGPPFTEQQEQAELACKAALEALENLQTFRKDVKETLGQAVDGLEIDLRIGVSTGDMIVGTIGSKASMNFTVMGDPVNLGSRLEGACKAYGIRILISELTHKLVCNRFITREIDLIKVKGKIEPSRIFELISKREGQLASPVPAMDSFASGLNAYRNQQWDQAEAFFHSNLDTFPDDPPSLVYLQRIAHLKDDPPPAEWDGVWVFESK
jgi:class 3 adenylate cyclase